MSKALLHIACLLVWLTAAASEPHPRLLLTAGGVDEIRSGMGSYPLFDSSVGRVAKDAAKALVQPIEIPVPRDGGGGYTHEKHKDNYYAMFNCGILYQLTREQKYAAHVRDMLAGYARLYPTLDYHPVELSPTPGRLFWQTLNECVWLVHVSVAYDCIYDFLSPEERAVFERDIFRPMAQFIMEGNERNTRTFNRMHNHGTWAAAAVGMAGYAIGDDEMVDKALYGSDGTGRNGGFMMQMDNLFSPDGYFTEGAYYQRYAIWPFVIFAQAVDNNQPEKAIFAHRDGILGKALGALLQLAYDGQFFLFNDALPKGYDAQELVYAVDILYNADPGNSQLLDIAQRYQERVLPTDAGFAVARDIAKGKAEPLKRESMLLRDGADGTQGGVAIMRGEGSALLFKATSHGLSHGHYDKLMMAYYDNGHSVLADYGAARFVNIEAKYKGHYTPENKTFAMTSIAHNTVTVDERSHFGGVYAESMKHASSIRYFDASDAACRIVSGEENNAYPGVKMQRTVAWVDSGITQHPLILDIFRLASDGRHTYDYPFYYNGQMISLNMPYRRSVVQMHPLGDADGYRHLWVEARADNDRDFSCFTWLTGDRFYSLSTLAGKPNEIVLARTGANDPDFHLRSEQCFMIRQPDSGDHTFFSVVETHGKYDAVAEQTSQAVSAVRGMELLTDTGDHTVAAVTMAAGGRLVLCLANADTSPGKQHTVAAEGKTYKWTGPYSYFTEKRQNQTN